MVALIRTGRLEPEGLVAITFTEAAAAELRARIRESLERTGEPGCLAAAGRLDLAAIDTIHAFAAGLLRAYPLEAGLPPSFETLEPIEQELEFKDRFRAWFETAAEDERSSRAIKNALLLGLTPDRLEAVARALHENHDLLTRDSSWPALPAPDALQVAPAIATELEALRPYLDRCTEAGDRMRERVESLQFTAERLRAAVNEGQALRALMDLERFEPWKTGSKGNWGPGALNELRSRLEPVVEDAQSVLDARRAEIFNSLLKALRDFVLDYAVERRRRGVATFHDLLALARDLLRDRPDVRSRAQARWSHIFVDEFQDTDPLQAELAVYLAADPNAAFPDRWIDASLVPGKLFVVGDPKQSIYRFRRADIALYQRVQAKVGEAVALTQNFRSVPRVIDFVNAHFSVHMAFKPDVQPEYRPLVAEPPDTGRGLYWFGSALELRARQSEVWKNEAEDVARACRLVHDQRWQVSEGGGADRRQRDAEWSDICILIPTRRNLRNLERQLERYQVPYRLESGELIVMTQEVRDLVSCLRAIDDPSDQVALVAALRSPAYGCSDAELLAWKDSGGRFSHERPGDGASGRVRDALADLARLHALRHSLSVPALVDRFLDDRMLVAAAFGDWRPREAWRRYRYVVKRARDFAATGRATLRAFVEWMEGLERERFRDPSASGSERDEDSVRVLTIHGAKGLEFPVVILTGWGSVRPAVANGVVPDRINQRLEIGIREWQTWGYQQAAELEKEMESAEAIRLTYVAATRARDHLLLSVNRRDGATPRPQAEDFAATLEEAGIGERLDLSSILPVLSAVPPAIPQVSPEEHQVDEEAWVRNREQLITTQAGVPATTPSAVARAALEAGDEESTGRRGRAGTGFGRAVHAVLQVADLATLVDVDDLARVAAEAEGMAGRAPEVAAAVRRAAGSEPVRAALAMQHWREMPLGAEIDGIVLEGFIDLLADEPEGLRVVDYKTDGLASSDIDTRFSHYRLQGGAYALLVAAVTGRPVTTVDFVFSDPGEVRSLKDAALASAVEEVRRRLREGASLDEEGERGQTAGYQREPEGELLAMAEPGHDDAREDGGLESAEDQLGLPL